MANGQWSMVNGQWKKAEADTASQQSPTEPNSPLTSHPSPLTSHPSHLMKYVRQRPRSRQLSPRKQPPVIFDSTLTSLTCQDLEQQLRNEGYLNASVSSSHQTRKRKTTVTYTLSLGEPYTIGSLRYEIADSAIAPIILSPVHSSGVLAAASPTTPPNSLLHEGMRFDVSSLDAERKRITTLLNDSGYYRFNKDYITYKADTTAGSKLIDLTLRLAAPTPHRRYWMRHITYNTLPLRHHVLEECTHLYSGQPYSTSGLQATYTHFGRLQAVKYTNITLQPVEGEWSMVNGQWSMGADSLDCDIQLQMNKPSTISFEPEGTNTAGDLGAAASLTYQNRNLFRGSEVFSIQLRGAYEAIKGLEGYSNQDFVEYSAEAKLQFPRFILSPLFSSSYSNNFNSRLNTTSEIALLFDMQDRPEFHRRLVSASWRYRWSLQGSPSRYQVDLLDLNYVFMPWISQTFRREYLDSDNNRNAILRYNYEDLFITKIGFRYSYANNVTALKTNIETSGNVLQLLSKTFGAEKDDLGHYRLFNIAFAQYVRGDFDISHTIHTGMTHQLVLHLGLGIAWPYGNSTVLPFEKRYFSGGANSVRGWSVRSLGPGRYKERDGRINFINQTGDMKLDLNAEWRARMFWKLSGALFVDAGNIWTLRDYKDQPGGQFKPSEFISQIAVAYGLGLRFNFDYFILRFDLGMKAVNPTHDPHYPIANPRFSRDHAFHFAVGLPF